MSAMRDWLKSQLEEPVVQAHLELFPLLGIQLWRERERVPARKTACPACHKVFSVNVSAPSDGGHPDTHGYVPIKLLSERNAPTVNWPVPLYIEMKRPVGGVEGVKQRDTIERINRDGGIAFFTRSIDETAEKLKARGVRWPL